MRLILPLFTLFALTACSDPINVDEESSILSQNEISAQRLAWNAQRGAQGYSIEVNRSCSCVMPADFFFDYRISVNSANSNVLIEAIDETGNVLQVLSDNPTYYPNMDGIFDLMDNHLNQGGLLYGSFDGIESYPSRINLEPNWSYEITLIEYF